MMLIFMHNQSIIFQRFEFDLNFASWLVPSSPDRAVQVRAILGDPGAVNGGARKINRRDERFHESLQGGVKEPLGTDSHQTISKRLGECWLLIGQKIPLYYSAQSANGSF